MRPYKISDTTREALATLSRPPAGPVRQLLGRQREQETELIHQIGVADELASVMALSQFLSGPERMVGIVAHAISTIMFQRDPLQLARLDDQCRNYSEYSITVWDWAKLGKSALTRFHAPQMLGLFSMHPSGWVREEAVRRLALSDDDQALTFLLIRSNDWVPQIRKLALVAIIRRATPSNIKNYVENLALIDRCTRKIRGDFSMARAAIDNLLIAFPDQLEQCLSTGDFRLRRAIYDVSERFESPARRHFVRLALRESDPLSRLRAARSLAVFTDVTEKRRFVDALIKDRFHAIRLVGLRTSLDDTPDRKESVLKELLVDRSQSVRNAARFHLRDAGLVSDNDYFAEQYREALKQGDLFAGLGGLGECGDLSDIKRIEAYLSHEQPTVASAALDSICKLTETDQVELLLAFLGHKYPRCSRTAAHWLSKDQDPLVHEACLANIDDQALDGHVRRNSLMVALQQNKWSALEAILTALKDGQTELAELGGEALSLWLHRFNRTFVEATERQNVRLGKLLVMANLDRLVRRRLSKLLE